ncbi:hypothetical protein SEEN554_21670 [Salmonella enterica subsp. enterica serovar Newport str. CVM 21554]|nr:hypothetical protein SEEN554_21670 [Salmonella enterica subsp. enterica serovar Newport str. CVM 21554]
MGVPLERFIPAGAGNTYPACDRDSFPAVYPRWRGEHEVAKYCQRDFFGLSPLARGTRPCEFQSAFSPRFIPAGAGTLYQSVNIFHLLRFIPAGAGNTVRSRSSRHTSPVYPRWRGEHDCTGVSMEQLTVYPAGAGTRNFHRGYFGYWWFIPAGAGNTILTCFTLLPSAVYPRWRGNTQQ